MDIKGLNGTLTARQEKAIAAVLEGRNIREGLAKAQVSPSVFYKWLREEEAFRDELERRRKELIDEGYHLLKVSVLEAASTILELLKSAQGEAIRLRAAESVLERVCKIREIEGIEERLTALERSLKK
ncbi:MAG: hypothetical protein Q8P48_11025 [Deltaproteobacteria bacterium]|nr:hypothetical protein [Deltaproteobacteria bacterium]